MRGRAGSAANVPNTIALTRNDISIPDGTKVRVYGFARSVLQRPNLVTFNIYLDGTLVASATPAADAGNEYYFQIGGWTDITVAGSTHTLQFVAVSTDYEANVALFDVDDFAIVSAPCSYISYIPRSAIE